MTTTDSAMSAPDAHQTDLLETLRDQAVSVSVYLKSGIRLQGKIIQVDRFTLMLQGGSVDQIIYKHVISTVIPSDGDARSARPTTRQTDNTGTPSVRIQQRKRRI